MSTVNTDRFGIGAGRAWLESATIGPSGVEYRFRLRPAKETTVDYKAILTSRLTQLASRYVGAFLVAKAGFDATQAQTTVNDLVAAAVGLVLVAADHVIHSSRAQALIQKYWS